MPSIRLSEPDRERLGAPDLLPFDLSSITNREAIALRELGYPTPRQFRAALKAVEVVTDDGEKYWREDYLAWTGFVWLALRRSGVVTDLSTLEYDHDGLEYVPDVDPVSAPGKAPGPARSRNSTPTS